MTYCRLKRRIYWLVTCHFLLWVGETLSSTNAGVVGTLANPRRMAEDIEVQRSGISSPQGTSAGTLPDPQELLNTLFRPMEVRDIACRATVVLSSPAQKQPPVLLYLQYFVKPPNKFKMILTSRSAPPQLELDFFRHKVGMVYLVSGSRVFVYEPFSTRIYSHDLTSFPPLPGPITRLYGTGDVAEIQSHIVGFQQGMPTLENIKDLHWVEKDAPMPEKMACLKLTYQRPVGIWRQCLAYWLWYVDIKKPSLLKAVGFDPDGKKVIETEFSNFIRYKDDRWVPLRTITRIAPGQIQLQQEAVRRRPNGQEEKMVLDTSYPLTGRTIEKRFMVDQERGYIVLKQLMVKDEQGHLLAYFEFTGYCINTGLPDELFTVPLPASPEKD